MSNQKKTNLDNTNKIILKFYPEELSSIFTSNAQNDGGMFDLNSEMKEYLPGAGAVESKWRLELPSKLRCFDYGTISDVNLHISYTAKDEREFRTIVEIDKDLKQADVSLLGNPVKQWVINAGVNGLERSAYLLKYTIS